MTYNRHTNAFFSRRELAGDAISSCCTAGWQIWKMLAQLVSDKIKKHILLRRRRRWTTTITLSAKAIAFNKLTARVSWQGWLGISILLVIWQSEVDDFAATDEMVQCGFD